MELNEYQQRATSTAIYPGQGDLNGLLYTALGLGEAGEIQGKVKKILRDNGGNLTVTNSEAIAAELGDLFWYIACMADELSYDLEEIAQLNLDKLESRKERGVLQGSGDNR